MCALKRRGRGRSTVAADEFGGFADGGLAILDEHGQRIHFTPSRVASALRYFVARVELHSNEGLPPRLAMSSALVGEGVTFITRSLASVLAYDVDATVAVVDLNWRRPRRPGDADKATVKARAKAKTKGSDKDKDKDKATATATDGEQDTGAGGAQATADARDQPAPAAVQLGLADAVEHGTPLDDILVPTGNPRLTLVPAGEVAVARRPALAASSALANVLDDLEQRFDHLLLDLPPVLATSETMNLSQLADAYALVVRQGVTSEGQVEAALEEMQGVEVLGVILNRFESHIPKRLRRLIGT